VSNGKPIVIAIVFGCLLIGFALAVGARQLSESRKARLAITKDGEYGRLAQDYRRLSELAVTAQEHADLKLGEINLALGQLRDQLNAVQRILKDVE
jgi:hypothetical protein